MTPAAARQDMERPSRPMLSDFGGFPPREPDVLHRVSELAELQRIAADCSAQRRPMRARCFAHSMNGMAVPRPGETLIDLSGIRHIAWDGGASITAGAGLSVWEVDQYVRRFGWKLPMVNDGGAGAPSVGGFVSAGGIGQGAMYFGGFWETVGKLTLVTADGQVRRLGRDDALFPWLFGSLGTLGLVYEASLDLVPIGAARPKRVPDVATMPAGREAVWPAHMWLTLFVSEKQRSQAMADLSALAGAHPDVWDDRGAYEYFMLRRAFSPPLVYGGDGDFVALGIWGDQTPDDHDRSRYQAMEAEFQAMVETNGYRRYFQTELIRTRRTLDRYVGGACAARYAVIKAELDPDGLLNAFMQP